MKLLIDLLAQYKGKNNGDLCASWTVMAGRNWRSRQTLRRALLELKAGNWIACTRQGGKHRTSLYAITIFSYDWRATHDIPFTDFRKGAWATVAGQPKPRRISKPAGRGNPRVNGTGAVSIGVEDPMN